MPRAKSLTKRYAVQVMLYLDAEGELDARVTTREELRKIAGDDDDAFDDFAIQTVIEEQ